MGDRLGTPGVVGFSDIKQFYGHNKTSVHSTGIRNEALRVTSEVIVRVSNLVL